MTISYFNLIAGAPKPPSGPSKVKPIENKALDSVLQNMGGVEFVQNLLRSAFGLILIVGAVLFFVYFLVGGIRWITSGGDKVKLEEARKQVLHATIGLVVLFSVFAIASLVGEFLNFDITTLPIDSLKIGG